MENITLPAISWVSVRYFLLPPVPDLIANSRPEWCNAVELALDLPLTRLSSLVPTSIVLASLAAASPPLAFLASRVAADVASLV